MSGTMATATASLVTQHKGCSVVPFTDSADDKSSIGGSFDASIQQVYRMKKHDKYPTTSWNQWMRSSRDLDTIKCLQEFTPLPNHTYVPLTVLTGVLLLPEVVMLRADCKLYEHTHGHASSMQRQHGWIHQAHNRAKSGVVLSPCKFLGGFEGGIYAPP